MSLKSFLSGIVNKLLVFAVSIFVLSAVVFCIARLAPGDPLASYYGERAERMQTEEREAASERLGLNEPVPIQYVRWLEQAAQGDFGISYKYKKDVLEVIGERMGNTLLLGGTGCLLTFTLALFLGVLCAWKEDGLFDRLVCRIGTVTSCIPEFWMCLALILLFSVKLRLLPSSGAYTLGQEGSLPDRLWHLILPVIVVVLGHLWYYAYFIRNRVLKELGEEYVLLARAKGLSRREVMIRHCLRNVIPSYISFVAISIPHVLGGTYVVETVFSYPGLGTLAYESARYKDYNLLMVICLLSGIVVMFCSMLAQLLHQWMDPRVREEGEGMAQREVVSQ